MEQIVIYLLMVQKFTNLKLKILRLQKLHYVQETFQKTVDNMKRTGFNGYVDGFSVDYDTTAADGILDFHKYLMRKSGIV